MADALSRVSPQPASKEEKDLKDFIPVHILTDVITAKSTRIADTTSGLLMKAMANGWPELKKDWHPLLVDC